MPTYFRRHFGTLCLVLPALLGMAGPADEKGAAARQVDAQADDVLHAVSSHMQALRSFKAKIDITTVQELPASNLTIETSFLVAVAKPDRFALQNTGGAFSTVVEVYGRETRVVVPVLEINGSEFKAEDLGATIISNGKKTYVRSVAGSGTGNAPKDLTSLFFLYDIAPLMGHGGAVGYILERMLARDPYERMIENATRLKYLGKEDVDGVECHELLYAYPKDNEWHIFIDGGDAPLIRAVRARYSLQVGETQVNVKHCTNFQDWELDVDLPHSFFQIPPRQETPETDP